MKIFYSSSALVLLVKLQRNPAFAGRVPAREVRVYSGKLVKVIGGTMLYQ